MDTQEQYRTKLKVIADLAFSSGIDAMLQAGHSLDLSTWSKETNLQFLAKCHDGYKLAQRLLLPEIISYQELEQENNAQLANYQAQRLQQEVKDAKYKQAVIAQRLRTLSHIADGIAWPLLKGQVHLIRRLTIQGDTKKMLTASNVGHAVQVAEEINRDPLAFALISDMTGYIGIGDLLVKRLSSIGIMELKEGKVNDQIAEFFAQLEKKGKTLEETDLSEHFDPKTAKQVKRMHRQQTRMAQAVQVMNTDAGIDPATQRPITVGTPTNITEYYYEELIGLREQLKTQVWAYTLIDGCVHIGMYRAEALATGPLMLKQLVEEKTKSFILIDWLSITEAVSEPLFAKPLDPEFMVDILTGRVKVIMGLDLDGLIEAFNVMGLPARWMSTKETAKVKELYGSKSLVVSHNRAITWPEPTSDGEIQGAMGWGTVSKILYDNINPTSVALSFMTAKIPAENPAEQPPIN